ncbi:peptidylprolyl isomerase [Marinithermus hydrothermalis]|uniref:Peptidyl-prolyl cis-trans isomerase n=1 Tax=Marinithermus hydrothermalis (strain DSM 14884 / JCM 11576 / T1) TaxID=869210 RepID=F2NKS4_MARHT|nr:peptidylprolyl isomerase [Marinithermus hydrothermalis]AEB10837.1 peptidyl-prolyl cis-trans isomerase cyclophilin type [Marinithermus hydrothermalis DSM 14884]
MKARLVWLALALVACKGDDMQPLEYLSPEPVRAFTAPEAVIDRTRWDYYAELETTQGTVRIDLLEDAAPNTVNSFVFLALHRYFEGVVWHRVIPGFVAQTGDPTGTGTGGPGYSFGLEIAPDLAFDRAGVVGMARTADPNSNGSQFFITYGPAPHLTGQYTIFGRVVEGMEVLERLQPTDRTPRARWDRILTVRILTRPKVP